MIKRLTRLLTSLLLLNGYASANEDVDHTYNCKFLNTLYMGICDSQEYIYIEDYSRITFKQLRDYNEKFVKSHENKWVTKRCHKIKDTYLFCEDLGLAYQLYKTITDTQDNAPAEESMHRGHDYYKKKAVKNAQDSEQTLKKRFDALILTLKQNLLTGEEEHDADILESIEQNQKDWIAYRYSFCQSQALIEVYPSTSRLYTQTLNSCIAELNEKRIKYLNNLINEIKK